MKSPVIKLGRKLEMIRGNFSRLESNSQLQFVRYKRKLAYPKYKAQYAPTKSHPTKDHSSSFERSLRGWLGPKNFKGEYYKNIYYYPQQNHQPKYIVNDGQTIQDSTFMPTKSSNLQPFPLNRYCKTNYIISNELKSNIVKKAEKGQHLQDISKFYGIKLERIEAIIKLNKIEASWLDSVCIK